MEERQKWRTINPEVAKKIKNRLLQGPSGKVAIVANFFDTEARTFALRIEEILKAANFEIVPYAGKELPVAWGAAGTFLYLFDINNAPPHAVNLQSAFEAGVFFLRGLAIPSMRHPKRLVDRCGPKAVNGPLGWNNLPPSVKSGPIAQIRTFGIFYGPGRGPCCWIFARTLAAPKFSLPLGFGKHTRVFFLRPAMFWRILWRRASGLALKCWSEWQDFNLRPPRPEGRGLPSYLE